MDRPNIVRSTLVDFEIARESLSYIPNNGAKDVFECGSGVIQLQKSSISDQYKESIDLTIVNRTVSSGYGDFIVSGYNSNTVLYRSLMVNEGATLIINGNLIVKNSTTAVDSLPPSVTINGNVVMEPNSEINISHGLVIFNKTASLDIGLNAKLLTSVPSTNTNKFLYIYCDFSIDYSQIDSVLGNKNIFIANDVHINVRNIPTGRPMSMTDYVRDLHKTYQNVSTIGARELSSSSLVSYKWKAGNPRQQNDVLELMIEYGSVPLGDFDLLVEGIPAHLTPGMQILSSLTINPRGVLNIVEQLTSSVKYVLPTLHIANHPNSTIEPAICDVYGKIIASGVQSSIEIGIGGQLIIHEDASVEMTQDSHILNMNPSNFSSIIINGTLIIDYVEQLRDFQPNNIEFGEYGKLVILNPSSIEDTRKVIFSVPNGILNSELYRLFGNRLKNVEFHFQKNTGIEIDQNFEDLPEIVWYNHLSTPKMDLIQAIYDKLIVWHDDAFISINKNVVGFVDTTSSLMIIGRFFRVQGTTDKEKTQDAVNKLVLSNSGNIIFRYINGSASSEIKLELHGNKIVNIINDRIISKYRATITGPDGYLYMNRNLDVVDPSTIVINSPLIFPIVNNDVTFILPE